MLLCPIKIIIKKTNRWYNSFFLFNIQVALSNSSTAGWQPVSTGHKGQTTPIPEWQSPRGDRSKQGKWNHQLACQADEQQQQQQQPSSVCVCVGRVGCFDEVISPGRLQFWPRAAFRGSCSPQSGWNTLLTSATLTSLYLNINQLRWIRAGG